MVIVLPPSALPTRKPAGVWYPSTVSFECRFELGVRHRPVNRGGLTWSIDPTLKSVATLGLFYEDALTLSENACAVQAFMVNESAAGKKPRAEQAPALDGLSMR